MSLKLPIVIESDAQYKGKLEECFREYNEWAEHFITEDLQFSLSSSGRIDLQPNWLIEKGRLETIERNILDSIDDYYSGRIFKAQSKIFELLNQLTCSDELGFLVSDIDCSYSTRLVAPFPDLHHPIIDNRQEYELMNTVPLSFFRARMSSVESYNDMLHIPLNKRDSVSTQRFSVPGTPCLYLGTSSYDIWRELGRPPFDKFNVSGIRLKPHSERGDIKILSLTASQYFDAGLIAIPTPEAITDKTIKLLLMQLMIWPLVCATSFRVKNPKGFFHSEYIISHLIMLCLPKLGIDGVAYTSKRLEPYEEEFALPLMLNIAIPVISAKADCKLGEICSKIEVTDPVNLQEFQGIEMEVEGMSQQCYFCKAFRRNSGKTDLFYAKRGISYRKTTFFRLDNYLCNLEYHSLSN